MCIIKPYSYITANDHVGYIDIDYKMELFVLHDGTSKEMIVFGSSVICDSMRYYQIEQTFSLKLMRDIATRYRMMGWTMTDESYERLFGVADMRKDEINPNVIKYFINEC